MDIGERKRKILHSVINEYIVGAEPVGSRNIAKNYGLGLSSATIRNEMADLEEMGYLVQPHTSAGRIPSDKGYRLYVNELMSNYELTLKDIAVLKSMMEVRVNQLDNLIKNVTQTLSQLTRYTAVLTTPEMKKGDIKTIELVPIDHNSMLIILVTHEGIMKNKRVIIPENVSVEFIYRFSNVLKEKLAGHTLEDIDVLTIQDIKKEMQSNFELLFPVLDFIAEIIEEMRQETDVILSGATNIFNYPEFNDIAIAKEFLDFLDDKKSIAQTLKSDNKNPTEHKSDKITVKIGRENELDIMQNSSVIIANYYVGDKVMGKLGIIGPTRMDYPKAVAKIEQISKYLNKLLYELYYEENGE